MTKPLFLLVFAISLLVRADAGAESGGGDPLEIGSARQLFIDELFFATSRNIGLKVNPAQKSGRKILQKDSPWENLVINWFNVIEDGLKYRLFYECYGADQREATKHLYFLCQAESTDGLNWTKPNLGIFSYKGSVDNNIVYRTFRPSGHSRTLGIAMFKDPSAPPASRIKAAYQGQYSVHPPRKVSGMYSADGLDWNFFLNDICDTPMDGSYSCFRDDRLNMYVLYGLDEQGQSIRRAESSDFADFPKMSLVATVADAGLTDCEFYSPVVLKYPYARDVYLMFVGVYQHGASRLDTRLAVSRDGIAWTWPQVDVPFIEQGNLGDFDNGTISVAQGMIKSGDELWQYYSGTPFLSGRRCNEIWEYHNDTPFPLEPKNLKKGQDDKGDPYGSMTPDDVIDVLQKMDREVGLDELLRSPQTAYSRVASRLDGFVSAETDAQGGFFVTPPLLFEGDTLHLNVKVRGGGSLRVGLLDENGNDVKSRAVEDCVPITGDLIDVQVKWKTGTDIGNRYEKPTRLRVEMTDAGLYSFRMQRTIFVK
jgi:hypothetical protein